MKNMNIRFISLRDIDGKLKTGDEKNIFEIGKWEKIDKKISYREGFKCSKNINNAIYFENKSYSAIVECSGKNNIWEKIKIIKLYRWQEKDFEALAEFILKQIDGIIEDKQEDNYDNYPSSYKIAKLVYSSWRATYGGENAGVTAFAAYMAIDAADKNDPSLGLSKELENYLIYYLSILEEVKSEQFEKEKKIAEYDLFSEDLKKEIKRSQERLMEEIKNYEERVSKRVSEWEQEQQKARENGIL